MKLTRSGKPVICHICGKNHCTKKFPYTEESALEKKFNKAEDTAKKESAPPKASVNVTIGEDWGG